MATDVSSPAFIQQLLSLLAGMGPQGFTAPIRKNLGLDIQMGGPKVTSGMTGSIPVGIGMKKAAPVRPDPLQAILKQQPLPAFKPTTTGTTGAQTKPVAVTDPNRPGGMWVNKPGGGMEWKPSFQLSADTRNLLAGQGKR